MTPEFIKVNLVGGPLCGDDYPMVKGSSTMYILHSHLGENVRLRYKLLPGETNREGLQQILFTEMKVIA